MLAVKEASSQENKQTFESHCRVSPRPSFPGISEIKVFQDRWLSLPENFWSNLLCIVAQSIFFLKKKKITLKIKEFLSLFNSRLYSFNLNQFPLIWPSLDMEKSWSASFTPRPLIILLFTHLFFRLNNSTSFNLSTQDLPSFPLISLVSLRLRLSSRGSLLIFSV